ncbi:MAG: hypothetical protein ABIK37_05935 [candidate division WOR-3 bacterium]
MSLLLALASIAALAPRSEFGVGADYTSQRYANWIDTLVGDTTDIETEARAFWTYGLRANSGPARLDAANTLSFSTRSVRDLLTLELERRLGDRWLVRSSAEAEGRWYHDAFPTLSDTSFRKSYLSTTGRLLARHDFFEWLSADLSDALEYQLYPDADSFNYDYLLNRAQASADLRIGTATGADVSYQWSQRLAFALPDQNYADHAFRAGIDGWFEPGWQTGLSADITRRRYSRPDRSYWDLNPGASLGWDLSSAFAISASDDVRYTRYDSISDVYYNQFQNRLELEFQLRPRTDATLRLSPQWDRLQGLPTPQADDYSELSLGASIDFFRPGRVWLSLEDRLGIRRYAAGDSGYQSDYRFNEVSVMANWTVLSLGRSSLTLSGNVSVAPEWHADETDNLSAVTGSLELKYGF